MNQNKKPLGILTVSKPYCTALNYTHFTKMYSSLHLTTLIYTSHPSYLNSLPFTAFSWSSPHFTSLHLSHSNPCSWKYSTSSVLQISFTLLHYTQHFPNLLPVHTWFSCTSNTLHLTALITFQPLFLKIHDFLLTLNPLHSTSLHLTISQSSS